MNKTPLLITDAALRHSVEWDAIISKIGSPKKASYEYNILGTWWDRTNIPTPNRQAVLPLLRGRVSSLVLVGENAAGKKSKQKINFDALIASSPAHWPIEMAGGDISERLLRRAAWPILHLGRHGHSQKEIWQLAGMVRRLSYFGKPTTWGAVLVCGHHYAVLAPDPLNPKELIDVQSTTDKAFGEMGLPTESQKAWLSLFNKSYPPYFFVRKYINTYTDKQQINKGYQFEDCASQEATSWLNAYTTLNGNGSYELTLPDTKRMDLLKYTPYSPDSIFPGPELTIGRRVLYGSQ